MRKIIIRVEDDQARTLYELLHDYVDSFTSISCEGDTNKKEKPKTKRRKVYRDPEGRTMKSLVLDQYKGQSISKYQLQAFVQEHGYAGTSINPLISELVKLNLAERMPDGVTIKFT